jgi:hypothetical protein
MSGEMQFAAATIIAILLAIPGFFAAKKIISKRQSQRIDSGTGYQAGGDIKVNDRP